MKTLKANRLLLPAILLCAACSKSDIQTPPAPRPEIRSASPFIDPRGIAAPAHNDEGSGLDPNGKPAAAVGDYTACVDPNG